MNTIIIMGNLTRDPQLSYTPNQTAVVNFGIAASRKYKDNEYTTFVTCNAFGKLAENINKYFKKGKPILVTGLLDFSSWQAQDGTKRSKHEILVNSFDFVGGKKEEPRQETQNTDEAPPY